MIRYPVSSRIDLSLLRARTRVFDFCAEKHEIPFRSLTHRAQGDQPNPSEKKRPRGRAPKGCVWSYDEHKFVPNEEEARLGGLSMAEAAAGVIVIEKKKLKINKRTLWHDQGDVMKQAIEEVFKRHGDVSGALKHLQYTCPLVYGKLTQGTLATDGSVKLARTRRSAQRQRSARQTHCDAAAGRRLSPRRSLRRS